MNSGFGALIALVGKYRRGPDTLSEIAQCHIRNMEHIINWDLDDLSAPCLLGQHQLNHPTLPAFLNAHAPTMPRTTLRYAIERLRPGQRQYYMAMDKGRQAKKQ